VFALVISRPLSHGRIAVVLRFYFPVLDDEFRERPPGVVPRVPTEATGSRASNGDDLARCQH
jgi:hypothetical protein